MGQGTRDREASCGDYRRDVRNRQLYEYRTWEIYGGARGTFRCHQKLSWHFPDIIKIGTNCVR